METACISCLHVVEDKDNTCIVYLYAQGRLADGKEKTRLAHSFAQDIWHETDAAMQHVEMVQRQHVHLHALLMSAASDLERIHLLRDACQGEKILALEEREMLHDAKIQSLNAQVAHAQLALQDQQAAGEQHLRDLAGLRCMHEHACSSNTSNLHRVAQLEDDKVSLMVAASGMRARLSASELILVKLADDTSSAIGLETTIAISNAVMYPCPCTTPLTSYILTLRSGRRSIDKRRSSSNSSSKTNRD